MEQRKIGLALMRPEHLKRPDEVTFSGEKKILLSTCQEMGYDFVALPIETGGRQPEEAELFLDRLVKYAGSGDSSDEARFRHFAATSLMMTGH